MVRDAIIHHDVIIQGFQKYHSKQATLVSRPQFDLVQRSRYYSVGFTHVAFNLISFMTLLREHQLSCYATFPMFETSVITLHITVVNHPALV